MANDIRLNYSLLLPLFLSALLLSGCPSTTAPASRITPPNKIVPPKQPLAHHQILARIFDLAELQKTDRYGESITPELIERYFGKPDGEYTKWSDRSFSAIFGKHSPNPEDKGTVVVISVTRDDKPGTLVTVRFLHEQDPDIPPTSEILQIDNMRHYARSFGYESKEYYRLFLDLFEGERGSRSVQGLMLSRQLPKPAPSGREKLEIKVRTEYSEQKKTLFGRDFFIDFSDEIER